MITQQLNKELQLKDSRAKRENSTETKSAPKKTREEIEQAVAEARLQQSLEKIRSLEIKTPLKLLREKVECAFRHEFNDEGYVSGISNAFLESCLQNCHQDVDIAFGYAMKMVESCSRQKREQITFYRLREKVENANLEASDEYLENCLKMCSWDEEKAFAKVVSILQEAAPPHGKNTTAEYQGACAEASPAASEVIERYAAPFAAFETVYSKCLQMSNFNFDESIELFSNSAADIPDVHCMNEYLTQFVLLKTLNHNLRRDGIDVGEKVLLQHLIDNDWDFTNSCQSLFFDMGIPYLPCYKNEAATYQEVYDAAPKSSYENCPVSKEEVACLPIATDQDHLLDAVDRESAAANDITLSSIQPKQASPCGNPQCQTGKNGTYLIAHYFSFQFD